MVPHPPPETCCSCWGGRVRCCAVWAAETPGGMVRVPAEVAGAGCSYPVGAVLIYRPNCVPRPWRLTSSDVSPVGKFPAGRSVVLSISYPEHPSKSRRDDSRVSLSNSLGKSLRPRVSPLAPFRMKVEKCQNRNTAPGCSYTEGAEQTPRLGGGGGTRPLSQGRGLPCSRGDSQPGRGGESQGTAAIFAIRGSALTGLH